MSRCATRIFSRIDPAFRVVLPSCPATHAASGLFAAITQDAARMSFPGRSVRVGPSVSRYPEPIGRIRMVEIVVHRKVGASHLSKCWGPSPGTSATLRANHNRSTATSSATGVSCRRARCCPRFGKPLQSPRRAGATAYRCSRDGEKRTPHWFGLHRYIRVPPRRSRQLEYCWESPAIPQKYRAPRSVA